MFVSVYLFCFLLGLRIGVTVNVVILYQLIEAGFQVKSSIFLIEM